MTLITADMRIENAMMIEILKKQVLNTREVLKIFAIGYTTLWYWRKQGLLKPITGGHDNWYARKDVLKLLMWKRPKRHSMLHFFKKAFRDKSAIID